MHETIESGKNRECCGCGVCAAICPVEAISLSLDENGYYQAHITKSCIHCGKCAQVCWKVRSIEQENFPDALHVYVGSHGNANIRFNSSSGGVGSAITACAIENGYTVLGAHLDCENMRVSHIAIQNLNEVEKIRGSKYVPSYTVSAFSQIPKSGKVLVVATPCQISSLRLAYGVSNPDMILVDFRCFGPSGYNLMDKYAYFLQTVDASGIQGMNMRAKKKNWHTWGVEVTFNDGVKYYKDKYTDLFSQCFNTFGAVHNACHYCTKFKNYSHADIRIEDAWHQMDKANKYDYKMGLSQIAVFTKTGEDFFQKVKPYLQLKEVPNTLRDHSFFSKGEPALLMELLSDPDKPLQKVLKEYKASFSVKKRIRLCLEKWVSLDRNIYIFARSIYKRCGKVKK